MCNSHLTRATTKLLILGLLALSYQQLIAAGETSLDGCNEYVCGSIVSKCLLTQSCQCNLSNATCLHECLKCLGNMYEECCACLDMCPKVKDIFNSAVPRSQYGLFEGLPELFETLTEDDDNWNVIRFAMPSSVRRHYGAGFGVSFASIVSDGDAIDRQASLQKLHTSAAGTQVNCTVIYLNDCKTYHKCAQDCENMGASSYRWFHDGCCECVGANCINYGINESRCSACPIDDENAEEGAGADYDDESMWTFGEEEHNYN
ncbi:protein twisted gastrulation [Anastrepha ludens]|uniref:protein twisted gastrulation n=1 Tax=Anastrepha ludens TaxID=28586 RepID=UPI0023B0118D|nr:protein twisted gastrulation [Anastrepha ludens]